MAGAWSDFETRKFKTIFVIALLLLALFVFREPVNIMYYQYPF